MATDTSKLAPRIIINEHEIDSPLTKEFKEPVTLLFGFSPRGRTNEMVVCNSALDISNEFGFPVTGAEKYFIDAGARVVQNGATAIMTRLPYDNFQCHNVKFVDYQVGEPLSIKDITTGPQETNQRDKDDIGVSVLKELRNIDGSITQVQRVSQIKGKNDYYIRKMTDEQLGELELDPKSMLDVNTFRIVDLQRQQYGVGEDGKQYLGIFPIIVTAATALYYQERIQNTIKNDKLFSMIDVSEGIEMSTRWFRTSNRMGNSFKESQSKILNSIVQEMNFDTSVNKFHRNESFQDQCSKLFPMINLVTKDKVDKKHLKDIGVIVCSLNYNQEQQTTLAIEESFVGTLGYGPNAIDRKINAKSNYIRMYKNLSISSETDCFICDNQKITSLGFSQDECSKDINYKTSILDPITHILESTYSDVDSLPIDVILDAGISSIAFAAYVSKNKDDESFIQNNAVTTKIDWGRMDFPFESNIQDYALVWNKITQMFGDFCKNVRGDCVYIADGPRILNLERNYPLRNYTEMENIEMFNKFLPYFNGNTNNYVARYWNWVYIEDMQFENMGFWVPGSVVVGSQLVVNDHNGEIWYAPAGQTRGTIDGAYDVSVRTKSYNSENDLLYQNNWNFFNIYQNHGVVIEGQKTLQTKQTSLDRLNVRRLICHIKQKVREISNRYKYEPHTRSIRDSYRNEITQLLTGIQRGSGISDFVIYCDDNNNPIETMDRHELHCKIGVKPIKAIEYVIVDIDIMNGKVSMNDTISKG